MLDIYINGRFMTSPVTGINRFAYELCSELNKQVDITLIVPKNSVLADYDISEFDIEEYGTLKSHLWEQIDLPAYFFGKKNYLLLNFSGLGPLLIKNKIVTIHDLSFLNNRDWFSWPYYWFYRIFTPLAIRSSLRILTVSEFSKSEIIKYYPKVSCDKIVVIYNAVNGLDIKSKKCDGDYGYLLTVGSLDPRKNLRSLLKAMGLLKADGIELHIVGGGNKVFGNLGEEIATGDNVRYLGRISDTELIKEYCGAKLFVLPSLYEGFGIPPLEALSAGCDIAISDIPVFREIFEDAAVYFNPNNPDDISEKIIKYLKGDIKISETAKAKVIAKFSWRLSASKVKTVLSEYI